jgi:nickel/cobalt transporter (NiCoT) family protein
MTLIDSLDSILMLYSYTGFPERSWAILERHTQLIGQGMLDTEPPRPLSDEHADAIATYKMPSKASSSGCSPDMRVDITAISTSKAPLTANPSDHHSGERADVDARKSPSITSEQRILPMEAEGVRPIEVIPQHVEAGDTPDEHVARDLRVKQNMISGLSIILTLMSILVAFR